MQKTVQEQIRRAVVRVTKTGGQGVLVPGGLIVTAAHCVEWSHTGEMVLGDYFPQPIATGGWCFDATPFAVEPVSDVAVLGPLDCQACAGEYCKFEEFSESTKPVELCSDRFAPFQPFPCYIFTHEGTVLLAEGQVYGEVSHSIRIKASEQIKGGTSGGPVTTSDGRLLGVVHFSSDVSDPEDECEGNVSLLTSCVPPWLLSRILSR